MAAATKTDTQRIVELEARLMKLEEKLNDLACFTGRVVRGAFGDDFNKYDVADDPMLVWIEELVDEDDPDEEWTYARWEYRPEVRKAHAGPGGADAS